MVKDERDIQPTNSSNAAGRVEVSTDRDLDGLHVLLECQLLYVLHAGCFGPVFPIDGGKPAAWVISCVCLDKGIHFGFGLNSSSHEQDLAWLEDEELMNCPDESLIIRYLAENGFGSCQIHESKTNNRRDASRFANGTYDLLIIRSALGGRSGSPRSTTFGPTIACAGTGSIWACGGTTSIVVWIRSRG